MSQLAQTRLTLLTQKCLPAAIWRHDAYSTSKQISIPSPSCPYPNYESSDISLKPTILNRCKQQQQPCCRLGFGQKPLGHIIKLADHDITTPTRPLSHHNTTAHETLSIISKVYKRPCQMMASLYGLTSNWQSKNSEILLSNYEPLDGLDRFIKFRSSIWSRGYPKQGHHKNERANEDRHHKNRHKNFKYLASSLGILGFMKKPETESDTNTEDDDRRQLTDAEKMKKMTPAELLIAKGVLSLCDHDHEKADKMFHEALQYAIADHNVDQETLVLNLLATNFLESGDLKKAEKLLIDLIKRLVAQEVEETDSAILELSLKLASIYSKNEGDHEKANSGFKFVINNLLKKLEYLPLSNLDALNLQEIGEQQKNDLAMLGWAYDWFAKFLLSRNDPGNAISLLKRALDISSKVLGCHHEQTLILLNDIGTTLSMSNSPEEGKYFIRKAVEGAIESKSQELASFYVNLGIVNLQLMNLNEAQRYCEYSIELALKNHDHHNTTEVIKLSQDCLQQIKRLVEVEGG